MPYVLWSQEESEDSSDNGKVEKEAEPLAEEVPDPIDEELETKDGVALKVTYYPPPVEGPAARGKETVPIIMLHMSEGSRNDWHDLALAMQRRGHAVVVPDLRGHGDSTSVIDSDKKLELDRMKASDYGNMLLDVARCKKFLMEKNNKEELNIDKLCLIGAEMGALVALNFAAYDWAKEDLPRLRQGKDVKALVLLSPVTSVKGFTATAALKSPAVCKLISMYIISGTRAGKKEAKKIYDRLKQSRPKQSKKDVNYFIREEPLDLTGTKLFEAQPVPMTNRIATYIKLRLVDQTIPWADRTNPLEAKP